MTTHHKLKLASFLLAGSVSSMSYTSGFAIIEQSVTGVGRTFALSYIAPQSEFNNNGSSAPFRTAATGNNGANAANNAIVPNLHYSKPN